LGAKSAALFGIQPCAGGLTWLWPHVSGIRSRPAARCGRRHRARRRGTERSAPHTPRGPFTNSPQFDARRECLVSVRMSGDVEVRKRDSRRRGEISVARSFLPGGGVR